MTSVQFKVDDRVHSKNEGDNGTVVEVVKPTVLRVLWDGTTESELVSTNDVDLVTTVSAPVAASAQDFKSLALPMVMKNLPVIRLQAGKKLPIDKGWQKLATTNVDTILAWNSETPKAGAAVVAKSEVGGVCFFEVDQKGVIERYERETGEKLGPIFKVNSSPDHYHIYMWQTPETMACGNISQKELVFGSFRQHNAYCVAPGSLHVTTGQPYTIVDETPIAPAPAKLIEWLRAQANKSSRSTAAVAAPVADSGLEVTIDPELSVKEGARDNSLTSIGGGLSYWNFSESEIKDVLSRVNAEYVHPPMSADDITRIAGSTSRDEYRSSDASVSIDGKLISKTDGLVGLKIDKDAKVLPVYDDKATKKQKENVQSEPCWSAPDLIDDQLSPVAPFDLNFLPESIRPWVKDVSERMAVSLDFAGICALGVIIGVTGRRSFVYPKAKDKEWKEACALSGFVVAESGKLKTPTWDVFTNVASEKNHEWEEDYKKVADKYEADLAAWTKLERKSKAQEQKGEFVDALPPKPEEPKPKRQLVLNDATPEAAHEVMKSTPEGVFYFRDELSGWVAELDKEGRETQREMFLTAMNGNATRTVTRITREGGSATMCLSVFGCFQPDKLRAFIGDTTNIDDGMIPRFSLMVWPDDVNLPTVDKIANDGAKQQYRNIVRTIAEMREKQVSFHFDPEAQAIFDRWYEVLNKKIKEETNTGEKSHLSKYRGALPKLAETFQQIDLVASSGMLSGSYQIDAAHINQAISFLAYLETHMHRIYDSGQNKIQRAEVKLAKAIKDPSPRSGLKSGFTMRTIQRKRWHDLTDEKYIDLALENLEEKNWVQRMYSKPGPEGGRPTKYWIINPALEKRP